MVPRAQALISGMFGVSKRYDNACIDRYIPIPDIVSEIFAISTFLFETPEPYGFGFSILETV